MKTDLSFDELIAMSVGKQLDNKEDKKSKALSITTELTPNRPKLENAVTKGAFDRVRPLM